KQLHRGGVAWDAYFKSEVVPILVSGYSPPLSDGLNRFLQAPQIKLSVEESLDKELAGGKADPMDSHPALRERISVLQNLPESVEEDTRPATNLLADFEQSDASLFVKELTKVNLKPVK